MSSYGQGMKIWGITQNQRVLIYDGPGGITADYFDASGYTFSEYEFEGVVAVCVDGVTARQSAAGTYTPPPAPDPTPDPEPAWAYAGDSDSGWSVWTLTPAPAFATPGSTLSLETDQATRTLTDSAGGEARYTFTLGGGVLTVNVAYGETPLDVAPAPAPSPRIAGPFYTSQLFSGREGAVGGTLDGYELPDPASIPELEGRQDWEFVAFQNWSGEVSLLEQIPPDLLPEPGQWRIVVDEFGPHAEVGVHRSISGIATAYFEVWEVWQGGPPEGIG